MSMIKDVLLQLKYMISQFSFNRKNVFEQELIESFGKMKLDPFNFKMIEKYFRKKDNSKAYQVLSDKTCNDLDFDDLFAYLDRTNSKVGQQYLYNKLRTVDLDEDQTNLDEAIVDKLSKDSKLRTAIQYKLDLLNHKDAYFITTLFQDKHLKRPKWFRFIGILSLASVVFLVLSFFDVKFLIGLVIVFITNFLIHYWNKNNVVEYINSLPQLLKLNSVAAQLYKNPILKELSPDLPISIKVINEVRSRMSFFKLEAKLQGDFEMIGWSVFELIKTAFLLEPLLLFNVIKRLDSKRHEIEEVFKFVGHIDMLISIASVRHGAEMYCIPSINKNTSEISAKVMSHPLIENCVTNDISISDKSILLTGSNMSGKTTFMRAVGLNVITALTINTCFAKSVSLPLLKLHSAIRISDDLMNNKSYYFEEVLRVKEMLLESKKEDVNLFLLDEIFKGTNTVERISAGKAILSALSKNNNKVLVSTHDIELTDMLIHEYELYHFSEIIADNSVGFDYKLKTGKLMNRNAIRILEINDYPKDVISEAIEISNVLDKLSLDSKD
jgi:DNA mismatch repair ATPase MutS